MASEGINLNNGERLYYQNMAQNTVKEKHLEETKKNLEDNYKEEFHFKPKYQKVSNDKYSNVKCKIYEPVQVPIYIDENETFQPNKHNKIFNPQSIEDIKKLSNRLHSHSKRVGKCKDKVIADILKECPFTPTISVIGKSDPKFFMKRQEEWIKKIEESKNDLNKRNNSAFDKITKQKLFHPKVVDPIARRLKRENKNVHIDLYNKGLMHLNYRKKIIKSEKRENLTEIENEKKERIYNIKEEREAYKKNKKEKLEKEIEERTQKGKEERENLKKIIDETLEERLKHKELLRQRRQLRKHDVGGELTSNKNIVEKNIIENENKPQKIEKKSQSVQKNKKEINTEILYNKKKTKKKDSKTKKNKIQEKEVIKKEEKKEEKKDEPKNKLNRLETKNENKNLNKKKNKAEPKNKNKIVPLKKEEVKPIITEPNKKKETKSKKKETKDKKEKGAKTENIKNSRGEKNEIVGEIEFNNMKKNKKNTINYKLVNDYNVVSSKKVKSKSVKKGKKSKK